MQKGQLPIFAELTLTDDKDCIENSPRKFSGTDNPRHFRVINSLLLNSRKREEVDRIAGTSNGPELIAELRRRGLDIPCTLIPGYDKDGLPVRFGVYSFTEKDRRKIKAWQNKLDVKAKI